MNKYGKIYYDDFRKKFAYAKTLILIVKINALVGSLNHSKNMVIEKKAIKIATETAQAVGSILSLERKDFHYKVAIR